MGRAGPRSSVKILAPEIRAEVDRLLADGRTTIDDVVGHLKTLGEQVSRSAMGRYKKDFDRVAKRMRESREMALALVGELPDGAEGKTLRLLVELLQGLVFDHLINKSEGGAGAMPADLMRLGKTIKDLASAAKINADRELKIRRETAQDAAKAATTEGKRRGLSADAVAEIERRILGVVR